MPDSSPANSQLSVLGIPVCGMFSSNCYLLMNDKSKECIIVDPGGDGDVILKAVDDKGLEITTVWLTHGHLDHLGATAEILRHTSVPVWIHPTEKEWCEDARRNGSEFFGTPYEPFSATDFWKDGDTVSGHGLDWEIHHIPGHSPGGVVILNREANIAFSGDLVLYGAIGRVDLPGSEPEAFIKSLKTFFSKDLGDIRLYPGHGDPTTFSAERKSNPYVKAAIEGKLSLA